MTYPLLLQMIKFTLPHSTVAVVTLLTFLLWLC